MAQPPPSDPDQSQVDLALSDLRAAWSSGRPVGVEELIRRFPELGGNSEAEVQLIRQELDLRAGDGEAVTADDLAERFPNLPHDIREQLSSFSEERRDAEAKRKAAALASNLEVGTVVEADRLRKYAILGLIAEGGVGAVWEIDEQHMGRPLALKSLLPKWRGNEQIEDRLRREARITGQLQHPGVPAVHDVGSLADGSPFFVMKLVQGETLSELLAERDHLTDDRVRFLSIFEQVCQTVGFAHSQGVIHRDLKPANVMVGAFAEVQTMDWGMAKVMGETEPEPPSSGRPQRDPLKPPTSVGSADATVVAFDSALTRAGEVVGTLLYMPPEQAQCRTRDVDSRSDVFALGGILCEILTGHPPYRPTSFSLLFPKVTNGELDETFAALDACDADPFLVDLCKRCLSPVQEERPNGGSAVAAELSTWRKDTEARLKREREERAAAEIRATEEKKRRRMTLIAAGLAVTLLVGTAAVGWHLQAKQAEEEAQAIQEQAAERIAEQAARRDVETLLDRVPELRASYQFESALALLEQAVKRLPVIDDSAPLAKRIESARRTVELLQELDRIAVKKSDAVDGRRASDFAVGPDGAYAQAFRAYGLNILSGDPDELARRVRGTQTPEEIVAALEQWALDETPDRSRRLLGIVNKADADPIRSRLRDPAVLGDTDTRAELIDRLDIKQFSPAFTLFLAQELARDNDVDRARRLLKSSALMHPDNFWLQFVLGSLPDERPGSVADRVGHYRSALAIRPNSIAVRNNLATLLEQSGQIKEAEAVYRTAIATAPEVPESYLNLAILLTSAGDFREAELLYEQVIGLGEDSALPYYNYGVHLLGTGQFEAAENVFRKAVELDEGYAPAWNELGMAVLNLDRQRQQEAQARASATGRPLTLAEQESIAEDQAAARSTAEQAFRRSIAADPEYPSAPNNLGLLLQELGRLPEAEESLRRAVRLAPGEASSHANLASLLRDTGQTTEAEIEYRKALAIDADDPLTLASYAFLLVDLDRKAEAIRHLQRALSLAPPGSGLADALFRDLRELSAEPFRVEPLFPRDQTPTRNAPREPLAAPRP